MIQTIATVVVGGLVVLDKAGILDKLLRRNGKTRATKGDIDHLANNHFHELGEKMDRTNKHLETIIYNQNEQSKICNKNGYILEDLKNKKL